VTHRASDLHVRGLGAGGDDDLFALLTRGAFAFGLQPKDRRHTFATRKEAQ
jgi:hypothetical protein